MDHNKLWKILKDGNTRLPDLSLAAVRASTLSADCESHSYEGRRTKRRRLQVAGALSTGGCERSYTTTEVRGSGLECQAAMVQEWPRGDKLRPRSRAAAERSYPASRSGVAARRRHPVPEVRGGREETTHVRGQGAGREELPCV